MGSWKIKVKVFPLYIVFIFSVIYHVQALFIQEKKMSVRCQRLTPVILATWEAEIRRLWFEARPGKRFVRPNLENTQHKKEVAE
jgi:hypothetical protein